MAFDFFPPGDDSASCLDLRAEVRVARRIKDSSCVGMSCASATRTARKRATHLPSSRRWIVCVVHAENSVMSCRPCAV